MLPVTIPNRPFSTEPITGAMLPDGFFESSLGRQRLNAHFRQVGVAPLTNANVYVESVSHPSILITPRTYFIASLGGGGARLLTWDIDVGGVPPGTHRVSFVVESGATRMRIIKKIFVTRVQFDPATNTFSIQAPEGTLEVIIRGGLGPKSPPCCGQGRPQRDGSGGPGDLNFVNDLGRLVAQLPGDGFDFCPPFYLFTDLEAVVRSNPPFAGQYNDLPFQDPWWKTLLAVLCIIFLIAVVVLIVVAGVVTVVITGGAAGPGVVVTFECCATPVAVGLAGLLIGAASSGVIAGASDVRDPFRRGQDNTLPAAGELTVAEHLNLSLAYPEPVALGKPYSVRAKWEYTRLTDAGTSYTHSVSETNQNVHVLSRYEIEAPDVVRIYKKQPFLVKGRFFGPNEEQYKADQLFVQCILQGTGPLEGRSIRIAMQDDGIDPDEKPADGVYTGRHFFNAEDRGRWLIVVIAQDVNTAQPNIDPEEAAQIIGGQVLTHQLTINFEGGTCPLVPDGDVEVI